MASAVSQETKIIYHIDEQDTPFCVRVPLPADQVTLSIFKSSVTSVIHSQRCKYFFKSHDEGMFIANNSR